jgi:signal transduction histidine kinase
VQTLARAAGRVAAGEFAQRVRVRTGDELEALGDSFNSMTANLQYMTELLNEQLREVGAANRALETEIAERRRTEAALRESEERLRLALSAGQMRTWEWDLGADTVLTSESGPPRANQPRGPERLELPGALAGIHPADRARVEQALAEIRAGQRDHLDVDYHVGPAGGPVRWLAARGRVHRAADGRPAKMVGVLLDVTDQKQAEEERIALLREQAARVQAEEALRLHDEFLAVAAHELKTPITSVLAAAQLITRQVDKGTLLDPARLKDRLQTIDRQAGKLGHLIAQLVDIGRLEAGKLRLDRTETDLTGLVEGVAGVLQAQTTRHALAVRASGRVRALLDPLRMEQVVTNLLDNAIRFSPGGGSIEVEVATPDDDTVRLAVSDPGIGIPPDRRARIFERFYQAHADDHRSGMGLGLYISRQIVELHGGHIAAEFPPQGGTRFVVTLPTGRLAGRAPAEAAAWV